MSMQPHDFDRRSPAARKLIAAKASFVALNGAAVAEHFGDAGREAETAKRMGLADLSPLGRTGFKGKGTMDWLAGQGLTLPAKPNVAAKQPDGALALRLSDQEIFLLDPVAGEGGAAAKLDQAWQGESQPPGSPRGFPLPRAETHAWFLIAGAKADAMLAKLCGVDLRPAHFADLAIAQTSIARMNATLCRCDRGGTLAYHLLLDSASAEYLWDCLLDAMTEFEGAPVGLTAVRALGG